MVDCYDCPVDVACKYRDRYKGTGLKGCSTYYAVAINFQAMWAPFVKEFRGMDKVAGKKDKEVTPHSIALVSKR